MAIPTSSNSNSPTRSGTAAATAENAVRGAGESLASAGSHLKQAATAAADSVRCAAANAVSEGRDAIAPELAAARDETLKAGVAVQRAASAGIEALQDQGAAKIRAGEEWVRAHPVAAIGVAFAGGYILSRLMRH